jgi:aryl-alcohol dehydrogenase-like predicted oxidoreductase
LAGADLNGLLEGDFPQFSVENAAHSRQLLAVVQTVAAGHGATSAQIALAWVVAQGRDVVPIPGTPRRSYLEENLGAADLQLTPADMVELDVLASQVEGDRYPPAMRQNIER